MSGDAPVPFPDHLRRDEVLQVLDFMAGCDPIIGAASRSISGPNTMPSGILAF